MNFSIFIILSAIALNGILFGYRKLSSIRSKYKWLMVSILFIAGLISLLCIGLTKSDSSIALWSLMTPAIFSIIDYGFQNLSLLIHHRDYYLWVRGSSELNDPYIKFKASDRIISIFNIYLAIFLPFAPILLLSSC
jgi:hypothetical protein